MSRIGKNPISIPSGVSIEVKDSLVKVKGPKGELTQEVNENISVEIEDGTVTLSRSNDLKQNRAMHGLYRTLINNMVVGVTDGYVKKMEVVGVGYRAEAQGNQLTLSLGFSHPVVMVLPPEIKVEAESPRGKNPTITLTGIDKQLLGQIAAKIRGLRPPEPYKGKGIRYEGEVIRRKAGKAGAK
ncbi:MAG: 50S ribosomal protein L6 [Bacteroidota bacterium]